MTEYTNRIYELRKARNWSQQHLADKLNCSKMQISGLERDKRELSLHWMRRFADVFGVTPAEILSETDNPWSLDDDERALIAGYRAADEEDRQKLKKVADVFLPFRHQQTDKAA